MTIYIGSRSDHCLALSDTHWITESMLKTDAVDDVGDAVNNGYKCYCCSCFCCLLMFSKHLITGSFVPFAMFSAEEH